jgi:endonuclease/exonuclease/phosphatase family metal-dependent hydrolase
MNMKMKRAIRLAIFLCLWMAFPAAQASPQAGGQTRAVRGDLPSETHALERLKFDELVELSKTAKPAGPLATHLQAVLNTPIVHNDLTAEVPRRPRLPTLGPVVRVVTWNIERGLNYDQIRRALAGPDEAAFPASEKVPSRQKALADSQLASIQDADILILNEVDLGMKRTEYRDVARELAEALHMNYAYGVEFVEVDPIFELGTQKVDLVGADSDEAARLADDLRVDRERYRGLHGTAILSRYSIQNARIIRLPICYDWYAKEAAAISKLENGRRWTADKLFKERIERELRHGGRMALVAQVGIPDLPQGTATVVAVHLENKCQPSCRRKQVQGLLAQLIEVQDPLILAGDFNTTGQDNTPTSLRYEVMSRVSDYKFWLSQVASHFNPLGVGQFAAVPAKYFHSYRDPTAFHFPILWENRERGLFKSIEKFRFADGRSFDFRGNGDRSTGGRKHTLANSNERAGRGFVPTYAFGRTYGGLVGQFKLDWIFVKPFISDPRREGQSFQFAPHFAATMRELNDSVAGRISDHPPMTVDLPLHEPPVTQQGSSEIAGAK